MGCHSPVTVDGVLGRVRRLETAQGKTEDSLHQYWIRTRTLNSQGIAGVVLSYVCRLRTRRYHCLVLLSTYEDPRVRRKDTKG
jgi:hypothetical protein